MIRSYGGFANESLFSRCTSRAVGYFNVDAIFSIITGSHNPSSLFQRDDDSYAGRLEWQSG